MSARWSSLRPPRLPPLRRRARSSSSASGERRSVEVDIEADDALLARYLERIPVIALDGEELYDFFVDEADLRRAPR